MTMTIIASSEMIMAEEALTTKMCTTERRSFVECRAAAE